MAARKRTDPLALGALGLLGGAAAAHALLSGSVGDGAARLALDVGLTIALGVALLVSFTSAVRVPLSSGSLRGLGLAVVVCVASLAFIVFVFVPSFMPDSAVAPAGRTGPVASEASACRRIAPFVAEWLRQQDATDARFAAGGSEKLSALTGRRLAELRDWRARFRRVELPGRLDAEVGRVDAAVEQLIEAWERSTPPAPSRPAAEARAGARAEALAAIRDLGAACVD